MNGNFTSLYNTVDENHYPPNDPLAGKHKFAFYPEQAAPYTDTDTPANECSTFSREYNSRTELMYRPENTAVGGDAWALSGMPIRAAAVFDSSGANGATVPIGRSFNVSLNKDSHATTTATFTVTFTTQFPIGAAASNYGVIVFGSRTNTTGNLTFTVSSIAAASFVLTIAGASLGQTTRISFLVIGG